MESGVWVWVGVCIEGLRRGRGAAPLAGPHSAAPVPAGAGASAWRACACTRTHPWRCCPEKLCCAELSPAEPCCAALCCAVPQAFGKRWARVRDEEEVREEALEMLKVRGIWILDSWDPALLALAPLLSCSSVVHGA